MYKGSLCLNLCFIWHVTSFHLRQRTCYVLNEHCPGELRSFNFVSKTYEKVCLHQLSRSILSVLLSFIRLKFSTKLISKFFFNVCCPFGVRTVYMVVQNDSYIFDSSCVLLKGIWSTLVPWGHHTQKSEFKECRTTHQFSTSCGIRVQRFQIRYLILFLQSPLSTFFCNGARSPHIATHCVCIYVCVCVYVCKILRLAAVAKEYSQEVLKLFQVCLI